MGDLLNYHHSPRFHWNRKTLLGSLVISVLIASIIMSFSAIKKDVFLAMIRHKIGQNGTAAAKITALNEWANFVTKSGEPDQVFDALQQPAVSTHGTLRYAVLKGEPLIYVWTDGQKAGATDIDVTTYETRVGVLADWPDPISDR